MKRKRVSYLPYGLFIGFLLSAVQGHADRVTISIAAQASHYIRVGLTTDWHEMPSYYPDADQDEIFFTYTARYSVPTSWNNHGEARRIPADEDDVYYFEWGKTYSRHIDLWEDTLRHGETAYVEVAIWERDSAVNQLLGTLRIHVDAEGKYTWSTGEHTSAYREDSNYILVEVHNHGSDYTFPIRIRVEGNEGSLYVDPSEGTTFDHIDQRPLPGAKRIGGHVWSYSCARSFDTPVTGDFNGDGRADVLSFAPGMDAGAYYEALHKNYVWWWANPILWYPSRLYVALSSSLHSWGMPQQWARPQEWASWYAWHGLVWQGLSPFIYPGVDDVVAAGDFNGDGRDDVVLFRQGAFPGEDPDVRGDVYVALSTGTSFDMPRVWHTTFSDGWWKPMTGDFNGDGKDDIVTFVRSAIDGSRPGNVQVALSTGSSFGSLRTWHRRFAPGAEAPAIGDVNGDGKDDIVSFVRDTQSGAGRGDVYVALSTGGAFSPAGKWHDFFSIGNEVPAVGDVNGDGRDDIITFVGYDARSGGGHGPVWVALSTEYLRFGSSSVWHERFATDQDIPLVADFTGDGRDDIARINR